ncbi:MAG: phosphoribosylformylglycinamidine synthase subunit PurL, partial [Flexistipes sinusarabici]
MGVYDKFKYPGVNLKVAMEMGLKEDEYKNACDILGREPNYIELGVITAMWSEHCSYKSSKKHLKKFPTEAEWVVQGPGENAGIIEVDGKICACFKVESHNHPSYIEPYQGAATGVGGILRDVFTMGARPVCAMNSLRFGSLNNDESIHLLDGVVSGIAGYGNCFGVPTVGGEIYFHETYQKNPLVNAFALGLVDKDKIFYAKAEGKGNPIIYVGAKTGKDGIHGATMASEEFSEESESKRPNVQIGDPFKEKLLLEACLELMQTDYIVGIQDMGAAGLSSSSFEMASKSGTGVNLDLERVPVRETGMTPYEIMLSESQERMLLIAKKGFEDKVKEIFDKWDLDAEVIGKVTDDGFVRLNWHGEEVASLPAESLADDAPVYDRKYAEPEAQKQIRNFDPNSIDDPGGYPAILARMLSNPNIASKRWVYRQYDHMVQTNTVFLPGSDSALLRVKGSKKGIAVSSDCNGRYCFVDPYEGGKAAVLESALNVAVSGARPKAVSDCLNFGNPEKEGVMWQFVKSTDGMGEACKALNT